ncbi:MAG: DUF3798 domain-containing protein [Treponema sp.]|nr:DUF3798 domain-containing protein [Treponema sp.]
MVTGTVSQSDDDLRGAEELIKRYGSVGGSSSMLPIPIMAQQETTITQADDPHTEPLIRQLMRPYLRFSIAHLSQDFKVIPCMSMIGIKP